MASTYKSDKAQAGVVTRFLPTGVVAVVAEYDLAAALVLNDVIVGPTIPAGATVLQVILDSTDVDTGTPAVLFDVGDASVAARYISQSTVGQGGGIGTSAVAGAIHDYAADTAIQITVHTAPATGATTGTIRLAVLYTMDK